MKGWPYQSVLWAADRGWRVVVNATFLARETGACITLEESYVAIVELALRLTYVEHSGPRLYLGR
jgi:hypothetical protein